MLFRSVSIPGHAREVAGTAGHATISLPGAIGAPGRRQPGPLPESTLPPAVQPVEIRVPRGAARGQLRCGGAGTIGWGVHRIKAIGKR